MLGQPNPEAQARLAGFMFFDAVGNFLRPDYTLVSASIPEPSAVSMLGVRLMCFLVVRIRGCDFRVLFPAP